MEHQHSPASNIQQLDADKHQFISIAFERQITKLLPEPYSTKCQDYRKKGFECRNDCITKCKIKKYLEHDGWPGDVYANKNVTTKFSKIWKNPWSIYGHLEEGISIAPCSSECGFNDDCESVQYDVRTVRVKERDEDDKSQSHSLTIGVLPPKNLQIINEHVPKFERIEFLVLFIKIIFYLNPVLIFIFHIFPDLYRRIN